MTTKYDAIIKAAAERNGLDYNMFRAQLVQESGLDPNATSSAGALGIGQVMPKYWTGQHGLNTEADFRDPTKSIDAAAAIMGSHVKNYGGWNQALVAYNAGQGKGNKNINAYNAGELHKLPKETQDYVRKLGIQADPVPQSQALPAIPNKGVLLQSAPDGQPLGRGQLDSSPGARFDAPEQGLGASFMAGMRQSTIGTALRMDNPLAVVSPTSYQFKPQDLEDLRNANIGEAGVRFVMRNAQVQEDIPKMIQLARENRDAASQKRSLVGDLIFGTGEMVGDPVTYGSLVLPVGIYSRAASLYSGTAARVAAGTTAVAIEGAASNAVSEMFREGFTGVDADYGSAIASGALFSVGFLGATKAAGAGLAAVRRGLDRAEASGTAELLQKNGQTDAVDPTIVTPEALDSMAPGWREVKSADPNQQLIQMPSGDTLHVASGVQFSSHNPMNPSIPLPNLGGRFTAEVGDIAARSEIPEFRELAFGLVRTSRGYKDGSSGYFGNTAQDVDVALRGRQVDYQLRWDEARTKAMDDPSLLGADLSYVERKRLVDERVMRAVDTGDYSGLTPAERAAAEIRAERYGQLAELQVNPGAQWGVNAPSLLNRASVKENYQPVVYNELKVDSFRSRWTPEVAQELVARSFYASYLRDVDVKSRVDNYLQSIGATFDAEEYAKRVAFGIISGRDALTVGKINLMMEQSSAKVTNEADFRKMRSPFGYDVEIQIPGGETFSVNDLRSWDADLLDAAYFNRVKGDVAVGVGTGRTPEEFNEFMTRARGMAEADPNLKKDVMALEKIAGNLYGIGIRNQGERSAALQGIFTDLAFMKSSAYMGLLNYTEIAAGVVRGGLGFAMRAMPGMGKIIQDMQRGKTTAQTVRAAQNIVWGSGLDKAIIPTYAEAIERTQRKLYADSGINRTNTALGAVRGATQASVDKWWTSRVLNATQGNIIEAARQDFFADLAGYALEARKTSFVNPKRLREASLTQEQMDGALELLRETVRITDGDMVITDAAKLGSDPRASHLRRYGQFWSERVIQQSTLGSTFRWSHLPLVGMFTQFMSFVTRSVNAKLIRGNSDIMRNGNAGEAMSLYVVGGAMGMLQYAGVSYLQATKFSNDQDRQKFLRERLGEGDDIGPMVAGAIKRMPVMSGPGWLYDTMGTTAVGQALAPGLFEYAGMGKTSTEAKLKRDARNQAGPVGGYLGDAVENAPAIKMLDSILGTGAGLGKQLLTETYDERQQAVKQWVRGLKGLVPNDPLSQRALIELLTAYDVN